MDSVLDPDNRLHLTTDEQLKALLDKLDMVTSMRTSGGRTKRIRLLRREINSLRQKLKHPPQSSQPVNGTSESTEKEEEEEGEEEAVKEEEKTKETTNDNGPLTAVPECGAGRALVFVLRSRPPPIRLSVTSVIICASIGNLDENVKPGFLSLNMNCGYFCHVCDPVVRFLRSR